MGLRAILVFAVVSAALLTGCAFPTQDPSKLKAIRAESLILMNRPADIDVPKSQWPPVIASLEPEFVNASPDGVDIVIKPYFDGGWGYFIPKDAADAPQPAGRYSYIGHGVYWFHPY